MTALCGGGASQQKPGLGSTVLVPMGLITAGLAEISLWLLPFGVLLDGYIYDLTQACVTDPPACPQFALSDLTNLAGGVLNPNAPATVAKIKALMDRWLWFQFCQCASVATPAYDCFPGEPIGGTVPINNPLSSACAGGQWQGALPAYYGLPGPGQLVTCAGLLPGTSATLAFNDPAGQPQIAHGIPPGITSISLSASFPVRSSGAAPSGSQIIVQFFLANGGNAGSTSVYANDTGFPDSPNVTFQVPANSAYWYAYADWLNPSGGYVPLNASAVMSAFCGPTSGAAPAGCCPPDPQLIYGINNILQVVQKMAAELGIVPRSYVDATAHVGLTGNGTVTLQSQCPAVRVNVTLPGGGWTHHTGSPDFYFNMGFITPIAAGSPLRGYRLNTLLDTVQIPLVSDQIGYTLPPGITITITELQPG